MGQKKPREKSAAELQVEKVTAALEEADRTGRAPALIRENPGQFLRDLYEVWHLQGGKEGGRWRNSIRKMRDEWLVGRNHVPSLHPKLMGRVKVTRSDARALIDLFLTRWRYGEGDDSLSSMTRDGYIGFASKDATKVRKVLLRAVTSTRSDGLPHSIVLPVQPLQEKMHGAALPVHTFVEGEYRHCDALLVFSRNRIAVGPNPAASMKNFLYLFNAFFEEDRRRTDSGCVFVWVVDLGRRLFEDDQSFREFYNAGFLSLMLQAFAAFDSEQDAATNASGRLYRQLRIFDPIARQRRWDWLSQRSVVVAENLRWEEFNNLYGDEEEAIHHVRLRDSGVTAQHILPRETPPVWAPYLKRLTGRRIDIDDVAITVLLNQAGWQSTSEKTSNFKCFAHARTLKNTDVGTPNTTSESIELPNAGKNYDESFRLLHLAAQYRLNDKIEINSEEFTAFAYLRKLGFNVLKIEDFIKIF